MSNSRSGDEYDATNGRKFSSDRGNQHARHQHAGDEYKRAVQRGRDERQQPRRRRHEARVRGARHHVSIVRAWAGGRVRAPRPPGQDAGAPRTPHRRQRAPPARHATTDATTVHAAGVTTTSAGEHQTRDIYLNEIFSYSLYNISKRHGIRFFKKKHI